MRVRITDEVMWIGISLDNLANGFNHSPNNSEDIKVRKGKRMEFAEYIASKLLDSADPDTGDNLIAEMFEKAFEDLFEGYEYKPEILNYPAEYD